MMGRRFPIHPTNVTKKGVLSHSNGDSDILQSRSACDLMVCNAVVPANTEELALTPHIEGLQIADVALKQSPRLSAV